MQCSILIRTLNEKDNLKILFKKLENQTFQNFEVVLIDSGSNDGTLEFLKDYKFNFKFKFLRINPKEFSFGRALNKAAENSEYKDILISLSAHCFPSDIYTFERILMNFEDNEVGLVYGKQVGYDFTPLSEAVHLNSWFGDEKIKTKESIFSNNGFSAFRYEFWKENNFDENVSGCEDIIFTKRIVDENFYVVYEPNSIVSHFHKENYKTIYNRFYREAIILNSFFGFKLKLSEAIFSFISECRNDISSRKIMVFPKSNFLDIFAYRLMKNTAQYFACKTKNDPKIKINLNQYKILKNTYFYN